MGNSCNYEHEEEILFAVRGGEDITAISSYLEFKGHSAVPD